jgi:hypothetical protein
MGEFWWLWAWGGGIVGFMVGCWWASAVTQQKLIDLDYTWQRRFELKGCPECLERAKMQADFESECG